MNKVVLTFGFMAELAAIVLSQISLIPDQMIGIVLQLPVVGLFLYFTAYILKWHTGQQVAIRAMYTSETEANRVAHKEQLDAERGAHREQLDANRDAHREQLVELFKALTGLSGEVGDLGKQVAINTVVVNESIRSDEIVKSIKEVLLKNRGENDD